VTFSARTEIAGNSPTVGGKLYLGTIRGDAVAGKQYADWRCYNRALSAEELRTLASHWRMLLGALAIRGGHHDAGDYNPRSHYEVAQTLMDAYEIAPRKFYDGQLSIPENANGIPDILDEAAWAMRLWVGLQDADGGVFNGTESDGDPDFIQTVEQDPRGDFAYAKDACGSFTFAGFMAQASRIWKSLGRDKEAADWLARAGRAYEWASKNPPRAGGDAALYGQAWLNPRAYAAAEMLRTTGEKRYNDDFLAACVWSKKPAAELSVYGLYDQARAAWAYANCPEAAADAAVRKAVRDAIVREADLFIQHSSTMAYAFVRQPFSPITWGTGAYENGLTSTIWSWKLTGQDKYRQWMVRTCDNTLGANPLGLCWVTGLGGRCIHAPLHNSRYSHFGEVVAGQQVEGPNQRGEGYRVPETAFPPLRDNFACLYTFVDNHFAIAMDEGVVVTQAKTMAAFGLLLPDRK
jgi:endoglucanase